MHNCIFSGHCIDNVCDNSCPNLVVTSYLLERNKIGMNNDVFNRSVKEIEACTKILETAQGTIKVIEDKKDTNSTANLLTYCGICKNWRGSQMHCVVYNLRLFQYIEEIKKSWSRGGGESKDLEYMRIFAKDAKLLIISNLDFINFKTFECQTLLELLQERSEDSDKTTIIVSPPLTSLVGESSFFQILMNKLKRSVM